MLPGLGNPTIAIAASRAGGLGVLDLTLARDVPSALRAVAMLARGARRECGVKVDGDDDSLIAALLSEAPDPLAVAIITPAAPEQLTRHVQALQRRGLRVWLEATSLEEAQLGEDVGVDGLIAKGHEAGGRVGDETTFVLLQRLLGCSPLPIWAQGGIGLHTAAACYSAGAAGVVLDAQLALTRESPLSATAKATIARCDGSETICLGGELGHAYRMYYRRGLPVVEELRAQADLLADRLPDAEVRSRWRRAIAEQAGWDSPEQHVWLLGQDAAFAASLAQRFSTVGRTFEGIRQEIDGHVQRARALRPLDEGTPLACSHGTRYPIVQGPMTRVSDRAAFAAAVAEGGGLPFLALALMRSPDVEFLLTETDRLVGDRPWGVGILGFVPSDLRQEQMEAIRRHRPAFALIAGGRPDQALSLERAGIPTYLHVPSPGLLKLFAEQGARRFVFEGRECGGHVGPRTSFVLWDLMIETLTEALSPADLAECHVLFAGGIHDALSSAMVATLAAPLAACGAKIGVLLGTAYLFTEEAVTTGAIVAGFQEEAVRCDRTVLLETGPGHATRAADTPYAELFAREKRRLLAEDRSPDERQTALEELNLGRLRVAAKGVRRNPGDDTHHQQPTLVPVGEEDRHTDGLHMMGQVGALRTATCTIQALHRDVATHGSERLTRLAEPSLRQEARRWEERPCDVAIIGMACLLPKAPDLGSYWENILAKVDAITEVPRDRWDWTRYFDPDPAARDKVYSKWGGFLDDSPFDPTRYGIPPNALPSIEPLQLLTLEAVRTALADAGYADGGFQRERTAVILGVGGGIADLGQQYAVRAGLPMVVADVPPEALSRLPEWTEDSFAGILLNVAAGRVANRFDLGGVNYTVDAACASSLAAVYLATRELEAGTSDMVIVGGGDTVQNPLGYLCFSKTLALSAQGRCRPFDAAADGIAISEGVAILVLKRLADAERDGDRVYAVIKGVAGSSDGRDKSLTAPRPDGQVLALERAYAKAGVSPATVGLIEAHGTGTVAGDQAEVEALKRVFDAADAPRQGCAIGSVKSMIGHTKCTAGAAGLIKAALALHHRVLPPTLHVSAPNTKARFPESPFYVNTESGPWLRPAGTPPRRAGISAFGFGGTNFHVVLEEYEDACPDALPDAVSQQWPCELLLWSADSRQDLLAAIEPIVRALDVGARLELRDLAYTVWEHHRARDPRDERAQLRLAVVATSLADLQAKLRVVRESLQGDDPTTIEDRAGIYLTDTPLACGAKLVFLFPGQGSQYPDMLREVAMHFPEVREAFEVADRVLTDRLPARLSSYVFPPPRFDPGEERARVEALTQTNIAQPALGAAGIGLLRLLQALGVQPDFVAGHSYGEYVALCGAGVFDEETLYALSEARGRCIMAATDQDLGTMAAVAEGREPVARILNAIDEVWIANRNAPRQTVISGTRHGVASATEHLVAQGVRVQALPVACAFHSPVMEPARARLAEVLATVPFAAPRLDVYANASASPYPSEPRAIAAVLAEHLVSPVDFAAGVDAMYGAGGRVFVEVGPRAVLTGLVGQILGDRPHLAVATEAPGRGGLLQLHHALGQLAAHAVPLCLDRLYAGRAVRRLDLPALAAQGQGESLAPTTWLVNGGRARPLGGTPSVAAAAPETRGQSLRAPRNGVAAEAAPPPVPLEQEVAMSDATQRLAVPRSEEQARAPVNAQPRSVPGQEFRANGHAVGAPQGVADQVVLQFQHLMGQFLETQQHVMLMYLRTAADGAIPAGPVPTVTPLPLAAALPALPLDLPPAVQHDVPHDVPEVVGHTAIGPASPALDAPPREEVVDDGEATPPVAPPSASHLETSVDAPGMMRRLLDIVSERTGYPPEMLDVDLNMEADLGLDSIKRVEILGVFLREYLPADEATRHQAMERLTGIRTMRGIVDTVREVLRAGETDRCEDPGRGPAMVTSPQSHEAGADGREALPRFLLGTSDAPR
jgi:acyl transferase domain-containing protein/NAD(P)H-dependent flavin oxidoreductase YrpB (nitropropane dioxygenase family)